MAYFLNINEIVMKILVCTFSFPSIKGNNYDGKFVFSEAVSYAENGAHVKVITPHYYGADKEEKINDKIAVFRFQYFFPKSLQVLKKPGIPIYNQKSFLALIQIPFLCLFFSVNIFRYALWADIIHAQWTITALLCLPAKWILGKKVIMTARGSDIRLFPNWLNRFIFSRVDAAIDCFGPQPWNDEIKKEFPANYIKLPLIVHNDNSGVMPEDMKEIIDRKPDAFTILYVGRFDCMKIKDNHLPLIGLIHVASDLKARDMNFHVFYVGDGDELVKRKMSSLIRQYHLYDYVTLLGAKINVPDYIYFCHLGVGGIAFNAVSQEFTISGKPQILVKGKDNADILWRHGFNAIFVEPDNRTDLAEKLIWAINNREVVRKIGKNARDSTSRHIMDSKSGGKQYLIQFDKLINMF